MMVYINIPLLYVGLHLVLKAYKHYNSHLEVYDAIITINNAEVKISRFQSKLDSGKNPEKYKQKLKEQKALLEQSREILNDSDLDKARFTSDVAGTSLPVWDSINIK